MKKYLIFGLGLLLAACTSSPADTPAEPANPEAPIVIGGIAPLSGDASSYGILTQNAANLRVDQINEAGGINGRQLEILWEDGKCNPKDASLAAQKLTNVDGVSLILGGACSGETLGAAPITEKAEVVLFSTVSSSPEVTDAGDFVFRLAPNDNSSGTALGDYMNEQGYETIGLVVEQTDYAMALSQVFEGVYTGKIEKETFLPTEADFKTRITKLNANEDIEALLVITQTGPKAEILVKQLQEQNWDRPIVANEIMFEVAQGSPQYSEFLLDRGLVASNFLAPANDTLSSFFTEYEALYGEKPSYENYGATTMEGVNVLVNLFSEVENVTNAQELRDALYGMKKFDSSFGKLSFDENGDVNIGYDMYKFDGEGFVPMDN